MRLISSSDADYAALSLPPGAPRCDIDRALLSLCSRYVPDRPYDGDAYEYAAAVHAYRSLSGLPPDPRDPPDWLLAWLPRASALASEMRDDADDPVPLLDDCRRELLADLPGYLPGSRLSPLPGFDARAVLERVAAWPEFLDAGLPAPLGGAVDVVWRVKSWAESGRVVLGQCEAVSERERATWEGPSGESPPLWRVTLSLPYWLLATDLERERLAHHELSHAVLRVPADAEGEPRAGTVPHELEESRATAARYGARDLRQALVARDMLRHPRTRELLRGHREEGDGLEPVRDGRRRSRRAEDYEERVLRMMRGGS